MTEEIKALRKALRALLPYAENEVAHLYDLDEDKLADKGARKVAVARKLLKRKRKTK